MHLLNLHPGVRCINEPFNPDNFGGKYRNSAADIESLDGLLMELWLQGNGIKHVWHPSGWPFPSSSYNDYLLSRNVRVVFLHRRNVLRRIVSSLISQQLNEWTFALPEDRERLRSFSFSPMDTDVVSWHVANEVRLVDETKRRVTGNFLELWYEDLYDPRMPMIQRRKTLDRVRSFLSVPFPGNPEILSKIDQWLEPRINRINSEETYSRIPGIAEVEQRFGSDETGWLFK